MTRTSKTSSTRQDKIPSSPPKDDPYFKDYEAYAHQQSTPSRHSRHGGGEDHGHHHHHHHPSAPTSPISTYPPPTLKLVPNIRPSTPSIKRKKFPKISLFGRHSERSTPVTEVPPSAPVRGGRTTKVLNAIQEGVLKAWHYGHGHGHWHGHGQGQGKKTVAWKVTEADDEGDETDTTKAAAGTDDGVLDGRVDNETRVWKQGREFKSVTMDGSVSGVNSRLGSRAEQMQAGRRRLEALSENSYTTDSLFADSIFSGTSMGLGDPWFKTDVLLDLADDARTGLYMRTLHLQHNLVERLAVFLQTAISEEDRGMQTIEFDAVKDAHLDKMLEDIMQGCKEGKVKTGKPLGYLADTLARAWMARFRAKYFMLDEIRMVDMTMKGRLKGINFVPATAPDAKEPFSWKAAGGGPISEGTLALNVGTWWLNLACAHRDRIVVNELEKPTTTKYGNTVLPLLTGREEILDGDPDKTRYIREGKLSTMYFTLFTKTKDPLRIIRGYRLRSEFAPEAGVRYDGLWRLVRHSYKMDPVTERWRMDLYLEREKKQVPMDILVMIPKPSQMDDWHLYKRLENNKMEQAAGKVGAFEWRLRNEQAKREREEDARMREFRSSIGATPLSTPGWNHGNQTKQAFSPAKKDSIHLQLPPRAQAKVKKTEGQTTGKWVVIDESRNEKVVYEKVVYESSTPGMSVNPSPAVSPGTREL